MTITPELITFFLLALVAVGAALGVLFSRNAVHSALFLVMNFAVVSVFYILLNAPFIALVQVAVYAGAIMVLFLFVIMLLGAEMLRGRGTVLPWQPALAVVLGLLFVAALGYVVVTQIGPAAGPPAFANPEIAREFGSPREVGLELYTTFLLPFELTSLLLLVAMIGAVVLTRDHIVRRSRSAATTGTAGGQHVRAASGPAESPQSRAAGD